MYRQSGLRLTEADNAVEAGIYAVYERLSTSRLKVFTTLQGLRAEYRQYHRDENGKVVKEQDHYMDALRYAVMSGLSLAKVEPPKAGPSAVARIGDSTAGY
jgi:hypothetical protein